MHSSFAYPSNQTWPCVPPESWHPGGRVGRGNVAPGVNRLPPKQFAQIAQVSLHGTNMSHANYSCSVHTERGVFARIMHTHERLIKMTLGGLVFAPQLAGRRGRVYAGARPCGKGEGRARHFPSAVWPPRRVFFPSPALGAADQQVRAGRRGSGGFGRAGGRAGGQVSGKGVEGEGRRSARRWRRSGRAVINERRLPARTTLFIRHYSKAGSNAATIFTG